MLVYIDLRLQDRNKAAANFRSAFTKVVSVLNGIPPVLKSALLIVGDSAWRRYSNPSSIIQEQNPDPLIDYYAEGKTIKEYVRLATNKIESLLGFAKPI